MNPATRQKLLAARAAGAPAVLATRLADGLQYVLPGDAAPGWLRAAAASALELDQSQAIEVGDEKWFLGVHATPYRLIIIGAVHIAQPLCDFAVALGYGVVVIDPRRALATAERFGTAMLLHDWPDAVLPGLELDARTAVVALSHDPKLDDPALDFCLRAPVFYLGALGSRKSHASRLARMVALGHSAEVAARIRGPVGLAIGALTAPEIAVSIVAEMTAARRHAALGVRG